MTQLWKLPAAELSAAYRQRRASPVEALEEFLRRCAELNPALNALVTIDDQGARQAARASERRWRAGAPLSELDGVPITVKDSLIAQGLRATWGSRLYERFVPERDELPVAQLRASGAVIAGKTNVPEFTVQGYTDNPLFGVTRNPWDTSLTPGGSSGGAVAAVAAGLGPIAIGTDGGGSTRRPASHTGLVGLKPSRGRIPRADGFPGILLDFEVVGVIARTVTDVECALAILGRPYQPTAARTCRILYATTIGDAPVDPEVAASVAQAARMLESLGHYVEETGAFDLPQPVNEAWSVISQVGVAWLLERHAGWRGRVGASIAAMAEAGAKVSGARYLSALDAAGRTRERLADLFGGYDLLLTPTAAALPWPAATPYPPLIAGREAGPRGHAIFTAFANAAGVPAISIPCAPSASGLPIGFQLVAESGADALLCAVARQYEEAAPWAERWPGLLSQTAPA